jgi:predicted amino acid racemase
VVGELRPEVISVFSVAKAAQIATVSRAAGREQALLLRVADPSRDVYLPGMEGGIPLDELPQAARQISRLDGVRIEGVTTFPALSYRDIHEPRATPNFETLLKARDMLAAEGIQISQLNAPGNTCVYTMEMQARMGATHVEPGHGALGTTPFHIYVEGQPERPSYCYVTEVAHHVGGRAYVYGGGFFVDDPAWSAPDFQRFALVGQSVDELMQHREAFVGAGSGTSGSFGGIDYYGFLDADAQRAPVGATVIFGFRMQSFVTRAKIAVIRNVQSQPELVGIWDENGHPLTEYA